MKLIWFDQFTVKASIARASGSGFHDTGFQFVYLIDELANKSISGIIPNVLVILSNIFLFNFHSVSSLFPRECISFIILYTRYMRIGNPQLVTITPMPDIFCYFVRFDGFYVTFFINVWNGLVLSVITRACLQCFFSVCKDSHFKLPGVLAH